MTGDDDKARRWQFSLRVFLGLIALIGLQIWLLQHGPLFYFFGPLLIAVALQLCGYPRAAEGTAILTVFFWVTFPCIAGVIEWIRGVDLY